MKILYDEKAAVQERAEKEVSIPKQRRHAHINNTIIGAFALLVGIGVFFALNWVSMNIFEWGSAFEDAITCLGLGFVSLMAAWGFVCFLEENTPFEWEPAPEWPYYSANVAYCELIQGKNVLKHEIKTDDGEYVLPVIMEDDKHVVFSRTLWGNKLTKKLRTDITETTVDLMEGVIYEPYQW